jgi:hypothetical protein
MIQWSTAAEIPSPIYASSRLEIRCTWDIRYDVSASYIPATLMHQNITWYVWLHVFICGFCFPQIKNVHILQKLWNNFRNTLCYMSLLIIQQWGHKMLFGPIFFFGIVTWSIISAILIYSHKQSLLFCWKRCSTTRYHTKTGRLLAIMLAACIFFKKKKGQWRSLLPNI